MFSESDVMIVARRMMALHEGDAVRIMRARAEQASKIGSHSMAEFWLAVATAIRKLRREAAGRRKSLFPPAFDAAPHPYILLSPDLAIIGANDAYLAATMTRRSDLLGCGLFDAFPENPHAHGTEGVSELRASLVRVLDTGVTNQISPVRYDIRRPDGAFLERWWRPATFPIFASPGKLSALLHYAEPFSI